MNSPEAATPVPRLQVRNLTTTLVQSDGVVPLVRGVSFDLHGGQTLALVGESGSGKSLTALSIMRLLARNARWQCGGQALFTDASGQTRDVLQLSDTEMRQLRGHQMAMIFQEPMTALNPAWTIGEQLTEVYRHHRKASAAQARDRAVELLAKVGIASASERLVQYPHQLSGGLRQRVMIAMALMCGPDLLIADEPSTALDVTIQAQILRLLADLQRDLGIAMVLITHDLGVVARIAHRVAVMYAGEGVEEGTAAQVFGAPRHPYTRGLLDCIPVPGRTARGALLGNIPGTVPSLIGDMQGCGFKARCAHASAQCAQPIELRHDDQGHRWRCVLEAPVDTLLPPGAQGAQGPSVGSSS